MKRDINFKTEDVKKFHHKLLLKIYFKLDKLKENSNFF